MHLDVGVLNALVTMAIIGLNWVSDTRLPVCRADCVPSLKTITQQRITFVSRCECICRVYVQEFINLLQMKSSFIFDFVVLF